VVTLLNNFFVPLYVENDEAAEIIKKAGKNSYGGHQWQLVQTHLILPTGELQELWRPSHNTGGEDPEDLHKALQDAIDRLGLPELTELPRKHKVVLDDPAGRAMEVTLRFPF